MTFIQQLIEWDHRAFYFINNTLSNPVCDTLMPWVREKFLWLPLYVFIVAFTLIKYKWKGLGLILLMVGAVATSDLISAHIIKPWVHRLRPCHNPLLIQYIHERINCGSGYSFVSSHASNHFAIASFLMASFGKKWTYITPIVLVWALFICFAQVYVGVHYPIDVIAGAILGYSIGLGFAKLASIFKIDPCSLAL